MVRVLRDSLKGMDGVLKSDIPRGVIILVTGGTGTLKSGFVYNVLSNYLTKHKDEFGVYATLEEPKESHLRNMKSLGIKVPERLQIFDYQDMRKEWKKEEPELDMVQIIGDTIKYYKEELGDKFTIFALDSLNALEAFAKGDGRRRSYHFFTMLRESGLTSFIVQEISPVTVQGRIISPESFMVDGLIELGTVELPGEVIRYLRVRKMRAVEHSMRKHQLVVTKNGLEVLGPIYER
jgi:KaiC/GvpD/RAD55 family RecA-like ATPase